MHYIKYKRSGQKIKPCVAQSGKRYKLGVEKFSFWFLLFQQLHTEKRILKESFPHFKQSFQHIKITFNRKVDITKCK